MATPLLQNVLNKAFDQMANPPQGERRIVLGDNERVTLSNAIRDIVRANPDIVKSGNHEALATIVTTQLTIAGSQSDAVLLAAARKQLTGLETLATDDQIRGELRKKLRPFAVTLLSTNHDSVKNALSDAPATTPSQPTAQPMATGPTGNVPPDPTASRRSQGTSPGGQPEKESSGGGILDYIKGLFVERDGSMKWGSILTIGAGGLLGYYFGGGILGTLLGSVVGAVASPMLDNFFRQIGLNPPVVTSNPYPVAVPALQPTRDIPVHVTQPDQTQTNNNVRTPILENLQAPNMSMLEADTLRNKVASLNIAISNGQPHDPKEAAKLKALEKQLDESQFKLLQFNQTFDKYVSTRSDYYKKDGERERLVKDVVRGGLDPKLAEKFVPALPDTEALYAYRPKTVGVVFNPSEVHADPNKDLNTGHTLETCKKMGIPHMQQQLHQQVEQEVAKFKAGKPSRIFTPGRIDREGVPQDSDYYFVPYHDVRDGKAYHTGAYSVKVSERYKALDPNSSLIKVSPNVEEYGKKTFLAVQGNTAEGWSATSEAQLGPPRLMPALSAR